MRGRPLGPGLAELTGRWPSPTHLDTKILNLSQIFILRTGEAKPLLGLSCNSIPLVELTGPWPSPTHMDTTFQLFVS